MSTDFGLPDKDQLPSIAVLLASICFMLYWFLINSKHLIKRFQEKYRGDEASVRYVLFTKYLGFLILGLIPALVLLIFFPASSLAAPGIRLTRESIVTSLEWIAIFGTTGVLINWFSARRPKVYEQFPQIRSTIWTPGLVFRYALGWAVYLLAYEFLFRAILFLPLAEAYGLWPALAVNIAIYALSHIPQGPGITFGSLIMGTVLCLITYQTEAIWAAWFIHLSFSLSNSLFALKFHPQFRIVRSKRTKLGE